MVAFCPFGQGGPVQKGFLSVNFQKKTNSKFYWLLKKLQLNAGSQNSFCKKIHQNVNVQVYDDIVNTGAVQLQPGQAFFWNEDEHYTGLQNTFEMSNV